MYVNYLVMICEEEKLCDVTKRWWYQNWRGILLDFDEREFWIRSESSDSRERGERERVLFVEGEKKHEARASLLNLLFAFS